MPDKRQFIAGAVCPRCGKMDKLVVYSRSNRRECVACDYTDDLPGEEAPGVELKTRVTRASARRVDTAAETVKVLDPKTH